MLGKVDYVAVDQKIIRFESKIDPAGLEGSDSGLLVNPG